MKLSIFLFCLFFLVSCFSYEFDEKNYQHWINMDRIYDKCYANPNYNVNITKINWLYNNKVESSGYCWNYQVFLCNQLTVCKNDKKCEYAMVRNYFGYRTKEELIEGKKHVFQKDLLERIDENIKNWKPYNEFIIEELEKRKEYCELEREICNNSKKKDKKCIEKARELFKNK